MERTYRHSYTRTCPQCGMAFETWNKAARYCTERCRTDAATARRDRTPNHWRTTPRACKQCSTGFLPASPNARYCSLACAGKARHRDVARFLREHPGAQAFYNRTRGADTLMIRVRKRYPDLPLVCEVPGCGEGRVLELAHRPGFERNGAWRQIHLYERHMFWVLCPTCHRVLDRGVETPEQMGLVASAQQSAA